MIKFLDIIIIIIIIIIVIISLFVFSQSCNKLVIFVQIASVKVRAILRE